MSKRSYRRLAAVAGAALAVGSVAPAMALSVGANGNGTATVDVSDVTLPTTGSLIPSALIDDGQDFALDTVSGAQGLALSTVGGLQKDVQDIVGDLDGAASGLSVNGNANANASSGGATVQVSGVATGASGLLGLVPAPGAVPSGAPQGSLTPVVGFGLDTATRALGLAGSAHGVAPNTAGGLLGTGLGLVDSASISGNVLASLMGSL